MVHIDINTGVLFKPELSSQRAMIKEGGYLPQRTKCRSKLGKFWGLWVLFTCSFIPPICHFPGVFLFSLQLNITAWNHYRGLYLGTSILSGDIRPSSLDLKSSSWVGEEPVVWILNSPPSLLWWCMAIIPALWRWRLKKHKLKMNLVYTVRPSLGKQVMTAKNTQQRQHRSHCRFGWIVTVGPGLGRLRFKICEVTGSVKPKSLKVICAT